MTLPQRFWEKVSVQEDGCWYWTGALNRYGYGVFQLRRGKSALAHRVSYTDLVGAIEDQLDHLCRVRHCVNPDHLEDVTPKVNTGRGRNYNREKTHCPKGHPYTEENTSWRSGRKNPDRKTRRCKRCHRDQEAMRRRS